MSVHVSVWSLTTVVTCRRYVHSIQKKMTFFRRRYDVVEITGRSLSHDHSSSLAMRTCLGQSAVATFHLAANSIKGKQAACEVRIGVAGGNTRN